MNKISYVIIAILVSACTQVTIILLVIVVWITLSKFEPNYIVDILEYVALATGLFWSVLVMIYTPYLIERIFKVDLFGKVNKDRK